MNITVSNIEKIFLTNLNLKGDVQLFIKALDSNEIPYHIHDDGKIEVLFFDNPLIDDSSKKLENTLKKYVKGVSKIVWKTSPLNCEISNMKEIFIRDLEKSLTIPIAQFKKELENSSLKSSYGPNVIALHFRKSNSLNTLEKEVLDVEKVLKNVKTIAGINWQ